MGTRHIPSDQPFFDFLVLSLLDEMVSFASPLGAQQQPRVEGPPGPHPPELQPRCRECICMVYARLAISKSSKPVPLLLLYHSIVPELTLKPPLNSQNNRPCYVSEFLNSRASFRGVLDV